MFLIRGDYFTLRSRLFETTGDGRPRLVTAKSLAPLHDLDELRARTEFRDYIMGGFVGYRLRARETSAGLVLEHHLHGTNRDEYVAPSLAFYVKQTGFAAEPLSAAFKDGGGVNVFRRIGGNRIELVQGDVTRQEVDAIVNAANSALAGGGGVDGAIHRAAGPSLKSETDRRYPEGCPTGSAVATRGGNLPAKYVFHAVGPIWRGGESGEAGLLRSAVEKCLDLAEAHGCDSVAFPAIGTGVYGYPRDLAAGVLLDAILGRLRTAERPKLVRVVLFDVGAYGQFARTLEERTAERAG